MMKLSHVLVVVVLVIAAVYFVSQRGGATEITRTGNDVSIVIHEHKLRARIAGPEFCDSLLVIGGMKDCDLHFTTLLSAIPLDTARLLAERYGNFRKCGSPGAAAGMRSVESMVLYAASGSVERRLKKINKLALAGKDPVIEMTFTPLEITDHKIEQGDYEMEVPSFDIGPSYLVTEVKLIQEGMTF
jgi:hypothetical protein